MKLKRNEVDSGKETGEIRRSEIETKDKGISGDAEKINFTRQ